MKIGKELFTRTGPAFVRRAVDAGYDVFLDLKFHDIPNTVAGACRAAAALGCWMINVHASGGRAMLEAAVASVAEMKDRPILTAVTILTSLDDQALHEVGYADSARNSVARLAKLSCACGVDGVVCSPREISDIKAACGGGFLAVTPGIRPADSGSDDQVRIATPRSAVDAGADFLVVGRPITRADDPQRALAAIHREATAGT